jgi:hypothetical protein
MTYVLGADQSLTASGGTPLEPSMLLLRATFSSWVHALGMHPASMGIQYARKFSQAIVASTGPA